MNPARNIGRILVTGAASGIGAQLCRRLREQGNEVIALDLKPLAGGIACDLSDPASIRRAVKDIGGELGGIAHVAGLPGTFSPMKVAAVNTVALRQLTSQLVDRMNPGGSIVVVSSITAHRCPWTVAEIRAVLAQDDNAILARLGALSGPDAYAASKCLANNWAASLSEELLSRGVRVNVVSPGPVETPILRDFEQSMGAARLRAAADIVGRHGRPDEIAALIAFLLSSDAAWVNGVNIACDGGFSNARTIEAQREVPKSFGEHISCN
ncbi:SDR family oxidoreductase [Novosphingobium sp. FGD1]|uniref:SDR family oxidoreductase n=1 Tax=Novosphingobium silvae TaxID=2692619 RepID=A0A7X4GL87_9SPHN|nr:SDR family oxidoreductase [Novosphingobium silvae]MYL99752.1 SDR family oxidoreductase [Novosphingobium silvae]